MVGMIRRSFSYLDKRLFKKLYVAFVRPHLEFSQAAWYPHLIKHTSTIERVQRRATKLIDRFNNLHYEERLRKLDLPSLKYRRERGDMIEMYKHCFTYDNNTVPVKFKHTTRPSRKHPMQIERKIPKDGNHGPQSNSFYYRAIQIWNELPKNVAMAKDMDTFKTLLDEHWKAKRFEF